ncbi:MAG: VOC family protein [Oscillatoriales cyanobacterium RM2_1_1]|nr:VOC family protein [Oscillatoriales cyanobacterium SM2_3_0]NJO44961.1 VOC family protein [Oscillatoriales cyanobacterium RM2_1_1]
MQLNPYLNFSGQCEIAFKFYEECLGGKVVAMMTYKGSPMADQVPPEWHTKIMHAEFQLNDRKLMGSDAPPEHQEPTQGFSVLLQFDNPTEAEEIFHALARNGTVQMPIQETFWASRFGMLTDQFGIPWMVNCDQT